MDVLQNGEAKKILLDAMGDLPKASTNRQGEK